MIIGAPLPTARVQPPTSPPQTYGSLWDPPYNTADHLEIPVPGLSTTEAMHPDVVDMGAAWNGYRYWMAFTPYNGNEQTEEPCIAATNDITAGGTWVVPAGFTNPITADPVGGGHMADTDILYDPVTDRLYVFYIADNGSTEQDIVARWTDGAGTWNAAVTVLDGTDLANPSVIPTASGWRMYYNHSDTNLCFRDSTTAPDSGYGAETVCTADITWGPFARGFQNTNIVKDDGTIVAVIGDATPGTGGLGGNLRFGRSADGGSTFDVGGAVIEPNPSEGWDRSGIYRSSVLTAADGEVVVDGGLIHVWYSAFTFGSPSQWGTAYVQLPVEVLTPV